MAGDLAGAVGICQADIPICIDEIWTDGTGYADMELATQGLVCMVRLFQHAAHSEQATTSILERNVPYMSGLDELDTVLVKSEIHRLYANPSDKSLCQLVKGCELQQKCEGGLCGFPQSKYAANTTVPGNGSSGTTIAIPKLEDLTKATGRMDRINPLTGMKEPDPITGETEVPRLTLSPTKASDAVSKFMQLRTSAEDTKDTPKLWRYDGKIWKTDGDRQVIKLIDALLGDLSYEKGLRETLRRLRNESDTVTFDRDPCLFPAQDMVIDLRSGEHRDYMPEDYVTFQYAAEFDNPKSDCRPILWHLCSSLPDPRDVLTALESTPQAVEHPRHCHMISS